MDCTSKLLALVAVSALGCGSSANEAGETDQSDTVSDTSEGAESGEVDMLTHCYPTPPIEFGDPMSATFGFGLAQPDQPITDLNVRILGTIESTDTLQLVFSVGPLDGDAIEIQLLDQDEAGTLDLTFDDEASEELPNLATNGSYRPIESLSAFDGSSSVGNYFIRLDFGTGAGQGTIDELCVDLELGPAG